MRKKVELLEHHPGFHADLLDITDIVGEFNPINGDLAALVFFQSIERANKVLIPALLLVVVISLVRTLTLDGSFEGIKFLFTPDWSTLAKPRIWLEALTQNAWDTGAGWGLITAYAVYLRNQEDTTLNAFVLGFGNNSVSLLAGIGFTMSIFIAELGFVNQPELLVMAKTGILFASLIAGVTGYIWLFIAGSKQG